jgi:tRNA pseudouridine55 synthase
MDGVLIIDKPAGMTSHDVVARVRRIIGERRVGHTGTLDPFATGVLVILVGRATRLAQFLSGAEKEYDALVRLGFATDTGDITGAPIQSTDENVTNQARTWPDEYVESALQSLRGEIEQVPPMYSAKKQGGKKLYELARRGQEVERKAVRVTIHSLEVDGRIPKWKENDDGTTDIRLRVTCSAGTYVRTLAEDFGRQLGVGSHLAELRRTKAGDFSIEKALSLEQLERLVIENSLADVLLTPDLALSRLPFVALSGEDVRRTQQGMSLQLPSCLNGVAATTDNIRMRDETGKLIAVGSYDSENQLIRPRVVLSVE